MGPMAHSEGYADWWKEFLYRGKLFCHCLEGCVQLLVTKLQTHLSLLCFGYWAGTLQTTFFLCQLVSC